MAKYVVAGGAAVSNVMKHMIKDKFWTVNDIDNFLSKTTDLFLTSIGEGLSDKKPFHKNKFVKQVIRSYERVYHNEWFHSAKKVVDSGGYQISVGYIKDEDIPDFIDAYIELLQHPSVGGSCEYMLSLDIVADRPIFKSLQQLEELNRHSLEKTIQCDTSKVYFVYHFVNPRLEKFWWQFVEDYFDYFTHFSVGGLVAFARASSFPFNVYCLPLLKIINKKIQKQRFEPFTFHILGVSSFTDIFSFIVFEKYLKIIYDMDISINFDSTRAVRETALAKRFQFYFEDKLIPVSYRSKDLHKRVYKHYTNADLLKIAIQEMIEEFNMQVPLPDEVKAETIYKDNGKGGIKREIEGVTMLASINSLQKTVDLYQEEAELVVKSVLDGNLAKATDLIVEALTVTNFGKRTKKVIHKARALLNSLDVIRQKPSMETLNHYMERTLEGVQNFDIFDRPNHITTNELHNIF